MQFYRIKRKFLDEKRAEKSSTLTRVFWDTNMTDMFDGFHGYHTYHPRPGIVSILYVIEGSPTV